MTETNEDIWVQEIRSANADFRARVQPHELPTDRPAADRLVVTCMDPRVNLEALGIATFSTEGAIRSRTRIVRTLGAIADDRSLLVAIHLPGVHEIAVLMHTDCGACLAWSKVDKIIENFKGSLSEAAQALLASRLGGTTPDRLLSYLRAFPEPREALAAEVARLRREPWMPHTVRVHGLLYHLDDGLVEVVVDGTETPGREHDSED
ncbi:MAG TPA: carbonic anhydrase [Actinomycetota bacterium]|jgi:carbonic anhydrase|nr:carbonic anhydrase [Actinomycetota bacterium]